jgi:hypothetical protein
MRMPPNFRRPDHCGLCRFFDDIAMCCLIYSYTTMTPEIRVCDDFRKEANEVDF